MRARLRSNARTLRRKWPEDGGLRTPWLDALAGVALADPVRGELQGPGLAFLQRLLAASSK